MVQQKKSLTAENIGEIKNVSIYEIENYGALSDGKDINSGGAILRRMARYALEKKCRSLKLTSAAFKCANNGYEEDMIIVQQGIFEIPSSLIFTTITITGKSFVALNDQGRISARKNLVKNEERVAVY